jgi:hypothetical protein
MFDSLSPNESAPNSYGPTGDKTRVITSHQQNRQNNVSEGTKIFSSFNQTNDDIKDLGVNQVINKPKLDVKVKSKKDS